MVRNVVRDSPPHHASSMRRLLVPARFGKKRNREKSLPAGFSCTISALAARDSRLLVRCVVWGCDWASPIYRSGAMHLWLNDYDLQIPMVNAIKNCIWYRVLCAINFSSLKPTSSLKSNCIIECSFCHRIFSQSN